MHHYEFNQYGKEKQQAIAFEKGTCVVTYNYHEYCCTLFSVENFLVEIIADRLVGRVVAIRGLNHVHQISLYSHKEVLEA